MNQIVLFMYRFWIYTIVVLDYLELVRLIMILCEVWISGWRNPINSFCNICQRHRK